MPGSVSLAPRLTARLRAAGWFAAPPRTWYGRAFVLWVVARTVAWVLVVVASHPNPPLDLVEWLSWGHALQWGYPKHPPLPAWLAAGFARLSPGDVWGVYVLGYAAAAGCLAGVWTLAREYLPPGRALLATVCLEGLIFLTNDPAEWSNNVALDLGWVWAVVLARRAVRTGSVRWWAAAGLVAGLTLLCKYTLGILLVVLGAYLLADPAARRTLRRPGPYVAALVAAAVFAPHAVWLVRHDFITLAYAAERSADAGWVAHVRNPAAFVLGQCAMLVPVGFVLVPALTRRWAGLPADPAARFLHAMVFGPVALLVGLSLATGCQLRQIWGSPLWLFVGVWALVATRSAPDRVAVRRGLVRAAAVAVGMMGFVLVKQAVMPHLDPVPDRPHFPGKELAREVNRRWNARFDRPFPVAAGEPWAAGNICCFSPHRPVLYSSGAMGYLVFEPKATPWVNDADLTARGGVIVWDADQLGDDVPVVLRVRFRQVLGQPPVVLPYQTGAAIPPARIGVAFIPPAGP